MNEGAVRYAGFWIRVAANLIDAVWVTVVMYGPIILAIWHDLLDADSPLHLAYYIFFQFVLPEVMIFVFWIRYQATPGKMVFKLRIADAHTLEAPSILQYVARYVGYLVSMIPLLLGYFWVGLDKKKRGFHDMMSRTVVIRSYLEGVGCEGQRELRKRCGKRLVQERILASLDSRNRFVEFFSRVEPSVGDDRLNGFQCRDVEAGIFFQDNQIRRGSDLDRPQAIDSKTWRG